MENLVWGCTWWKNILNELVLTHRVNMSKGVSGIEGGMFGKVQHRSLLSSQEDGGGVCIFN